VDAVFASAPAVPDGASFFAAWWVSIRCASKPLELGEQVRRFGHDSVEHGERRPRSSVR
jgi:hypothetical protein